MSWCQLSSAHNWAGGHEWNWIIQFHFLVSNPNIINVSGVYKFHDKQASVALKGRWRENNDWLEAMKTERSQESKRQ